MTKIKKQTLKFWGAMVALVIVSVVGIGFYAKAYQSEQAPKIVNEAGGIVNYNDYKSEDHEAQGESNRESVKEPMIGAGGYYNQASNYTNYNNDATYYLSQTFVDRTTTIVSIPTPFLMVSSTNTTYPVLKTDGSIQWVGATSTVDMARLYITGVATTSYDVVCGAAPSPTVGPVFHLIGSGQVATSSAAVIENNLTDIQGASVSGSTTAKILLTPVNPYFTCLVTPAYASAFTQVGNTFDGKIMIRVSRFSY